MFFFPITIFFPNIVFLNNSIIPIINSFFHLKKN